MATVVSDVAAGLMKVMDDNEVMAVIGHEIGHVLHSDSKDANEERLSDFGCKNAAGATSDVVAKLSDSQLGDLATALAGAQYSQKQEMKQTITALSLV